MDKFLAVSIESKAIMKILAVDDDESMLELIDHSLSISAHHTVTTALSAAQALEKIEVADGEFDCFLVDIQMPKVDGIDLTRLIRRTAGYERKPVVMLTAMHEKPYLDMAFQAGATDYITKPFNFRELRSRIFEAGKMSNEAKQILSEDISGHSVSWVRGELIHDCAGTLFDRERFHTFLPYAEFENYAQETARVFMQNRTKLRNGGPSVIGLKLACPKNSDEESPKEEIDTFLANVVQTANAVFGTGLNSVSYCRNGTFLCLLAKHQHESSGSIEREMNVFLQSRLTNARDSGLQLFVGNQVAMRTASPSAVLDLLWMANESVEQKFLTHRDLSKPGGAS